LWHSILCLACSSTTTRLLPIFAHTHLARGRPRLLRMPTPSDVCAAMAHRYYMRFTDDNWQTTKRLDENGVSLPYNSCCGHRYRSTDVPPLFFSSYHALAHRESCSSSACTQVWLCRRVFLDTKFQIHASYSIVHVILRCILHTSSDQNRVSSNKVNLLSLGLWIPSNATLRDRHQAIL
jgi:hypothetical protein